jgi:hypothetical protein
MKFSIFLVILFLFGCSEDLSEPLTPFQCRVIGVDVKDGTSISGNVSQVRYYNTMAEVKADCQRPFSMLEYGCAIPLAPKEYLIVVLKIPDTTYKPSYNTIENHERCHAYYETKRHFP